MPRKQIKTVEKLQKVDSSFQTTPRRISAKNILLISILVVVGLAWQFKSNFIAAMVNGQPISRWQLNDRLVKKFGDQTLDSIVNERLILAAARQKGIFVKSEEIESKVKQIEARLDGKISLDDALKAQGLTKDDFRKELEIQVSIEKLFEKDATVSSNEIDDYMKKNSQAYKSASDPAAVNQEIKSILAQQKINDLFEKWFADIQKNAKVTKFLK